MSKKKRIITPETLANERAEEFLINLFGFFVALLVLALLVLAFLLAVSCCSAKKSSEFYYESSLDIVKRDLVNYKNADTLINGTFCKQNEYAVSQNVCDYANAFFQMHYFHKTRNRDNYDKQKNRACEAYLKLTDTDLQVLHQYAIKDKIINKPLIDDDLVRVWYNWCIEN